MSKSKNEDIAIIGMAGIFPQAGDVESFWRNIMRRAEVIREVPEDRWRVADMFDSDPRSRDKIYSKWGGILEDIPFDPIRYGIPPVSLQYVEAVQLLALEITRLALEDTGIPQSEFPREKTAVIFGAGGMHDRCLDYITRTMLLHYLPRITRLAPDIKDDIINNFKVFLPEWTGDSFPGILGNVVSGRVANRFDLMGSNYTVDAACASSLASLDVGLAKLRSGQADAVIVGAVDMTNNVVGFTAFAKTFVLSPRGKSCPFDDEADGIVISEGAAAVVLKRLADAEQNGDRIHAVIKGVGSSSDGRNRSLTAPHSDGQVLALERAYKDAGVDPRSVGLIEAHGTGTVLGDKSEIEALHRVFGNGFDKNEKNHFRCALGSVKSNIGHTKIAAGLAGLIKGVLALEHQTLPPTMGIKKPNSRIDFTQSPFYLSTEERPWFSHKDMGPRRCGVSAFGFGGTNFHVVMEECAGKQVRHILRPVRSAQIFGFSSFSRKSLADRIKDFLAGLKNPLHTDVMDLAHALYLEEQSFAGTERIRRLYVVAGSVTSLKDKLEKAFPDLSADIAPAGIEGLYYGEQDSVADRICFLFPGQGSQKINMLRDLVLGFPESRQPLEETDALLAEWFERPLSEMIYPEPVFSEKERDFQSERLNDTQVAQPALAATGLFALDLLQRFGIRPAFTAGHSFGEYVALHAAGVISQSDLIRLAAVRGKLSRDAAFENNGKMAAIAADPDTVKAILQESGTSAQPANFNAPKQVVIGGSGADIDQCILLSRQKGVKARLIPVTAAFHTAGMQSAAEKLTCELKKIQFLPPRVPVYGNTTGRPYPDDPGAICRLLGRHIQEPLDFVSQIQRLYDDGAYVFIEMGPGKVLSNLVDRILGEKSHITLSLDFSGRPGELQLAHVLAEAGAAGLRVDLSCWFRSDGLKSPDLKTVLDHAAHLADPSPMTWRISNGKIMPWHSQHPDSLTENHARDISPESLTGRIKKMDKTPREASIIFPTQNPCAKTGRKENRIMKEKNTSNLYSAGDPGSMSLISRIQANLDQFIELQRDQQRLMERFLDMQQQLMAAALNEKGDAEEKTGPLLKDKTRDSDPKTRSPLVVPPAPVLPRLMAVDAAPVKDTERLRPIPSASGSSNISAQPATASEFQVDLLKIVSEQTGYPESMLDLDAHLEADLGIDSIKRVEIFSLLSDHHALLESQREEMVLEELADLKSLRKIIDWYEANRSRLLEGEGQDPKKS